MGHMEIHGHYPFLTPVPGTHDLLIILLIDGHPWSIHLTLISHMHIENGTRRYAKKINMVKNFL